MVAAAKIIAGVRTDTKTVVGVEQEVDRRTEKEANGAHTAMRRAK